MDGEEDWKVVGVLDILSSSKVIEGWSSSEGKGENIKLGCDVSADGLEHV